VTAVQPLDFAHWTPGTGDPLWLVLALLSGYAVGGALGLWLGLRAPSGSRERLLWLGLGLLLWLLAAKTQLGLLGWFTQAGRELAVAQGWYAWRRVAQVAITVALVLGGILAIRALKPWLGPKWPDCRLAVCGGIGLLTYVLVRAVSLHAVDALLAPQVAGSSVSAWAELALLLATLAGLLARVQVLARISPTAARR